MNLKNKKILVTGGNGFLGSHVVDELKQHSPGEIRIPTSAEHDLRIYDSCEAVCKGVDIVIHLAADVGGIGYNRENPYTIADNNLIMAVNIVRASIVCKVKKFVGIGTICEYPKYTPVPFKEADLWNGYPEDSNAPYGMAKKMLLVLSQAAQEQGLLKGVHLLPVNLYGPRDNFDPKSSHVVPALIKRFLEAKSAGAKEVSVWGTGKATREFLYVQDAAKGIVLATQHYDSPDPVNIGSGKEISIKELAKTIAEIVGYKGKINWDTSKPDGQPRRVLDTSKAEKEFGFRAAIDIKKGLKMTIDWYLNSA